MIKVREQKLGARLIPGFFQETLPVPLGSGEIQLLLVFERAQRVQFSVPRLLLQQFSQSRPRLAGRPAKRYFAARQRHQPEKCGFDLRASFYISNPGRKSTTCCDYPARGKNRERSRTESEQGLAGNFTERFQGPPPASRCCAPRLRRSPSTCRRQEPSAPESEVAPCSPPRVHPISARQERLLPAGQAASACFARPRPLDPTLGPGGSASAPAGFESPAACWRSRSSSIRDRCARPCRVKRGARCRCRPACRPAQRSASARCLHRRDSEASAPGRRGTAQPPRR